MGIVKPETVCPVADVTIGTCSPVAFHLWHPKTEQSTWCPVDASLVDDLMKLSDFTAAKNTKHSSGHLLLMQTKSVLSLDARSLQDMSKHDLNPLSLFATIQEKTMFHVRANAGRCAEVTANQQCQ